MLPLVDGLAPDAPARALNGVAAAGVVPLFAGEMALDGVGTAVGMIAAAAFGSIDGAEAGVAVVWPWSGLSAAVLLLLPDPARLLTGLAFMPPASEMATGAAGGPPGLAARIGDWAGFGGTARATLPPEAGWAPAGVGAAVAGGAAAPAVAEVDFCSPARSVDRAGAATGVPVVAPVVAPLDAPVVVVAWGRFVAFAEAEPVLPSEITLAGSAASGVVMGPPDAGVVAVGVTGAAGAAGLTVAADDGDLSVIGVALAG
jgi:hypothetical protein